MQTMSEMTAISKIKPFQAPKLEVPLVVREEMNE